MLRKTVVILLLATTPLTTRAAEWTIAPTLNFGAGYNDNIRMATDNKVSSAVGIFSPSATFSVETPRSGASGDLHFEFLRYEDDSNLDENNSRFHLGTFHKLQRSQLGLDLNFVRDTTLDSQLEATGLAFDRIRRQRISASPNWTWSFDERTQLSANYNYTDVEYKNAGDTGYVNYTVNGAQISLARMLSERMTASLSLSRTGSENDNDVKSTNTSLQGGGSYRFSETLSASLIAGIRYTEVDYSQTSLIPIFLGNTIIGFIPLTRDVSKSDSGSVFNGSVTKKFLRGETSFSASRNISNDINGRPVEVNRLGWMGEYRFSETFSGNLSLAFYNTQSNNAVGQSLNRDYYQISPRFTWKFERFWSLSGSYSYREQTFDNSSDDAIQNAAYLTLIYQWPRIAISR